MSGRVERRNAVGDRAEHRFVQLWASIAIITILIGFAPSWFVRPLVTEPPGNALTPLVIFHGLLFTGWIALFAFQIMQIGIGRTDRHRRWGRIAVYALPVLFVSGIAVAMANAARSDPEGAIPPDVFLLLPLCEIIGACGLIYAGWRYRQRPFFHKRMMLLAIAVMIGTATGRLFGGLIGTFIVPIPFILAIWAFDLIRDKRIAWPVFFGGIFALACYAVPLIFGFTAGWRAIAGQMIGWWSGGSI